MNYIKFDTIDSTNDFLKSYIQTHRPENFFYVFAEEQTKGKGQRLNNWKSECCKNILISYFIKLNLPAEKHFLLNQKVSVALIKLLQKFNITDIKIKHPNDILAGNEKISGILIENAIYKNHIRHSIIGIGLNVNQTHFKNLPFATSMKKITGKNFDREKIIDALGKELKKVFLMSEKEIEDLYNSYLYTPESSVFPLQNED